MKRDARIEVWVNGEEHQRIVQHARQRGLTTSSFARAAMLGEPLPTRETGIEAEAVAALNRAGSNLNQIARAANTGAVPAEVAKAAAFVLRKVNEAVNLIRAQAAPAADGSARP